MGIRLDLDCIMWITRIISQESQRNLLIGLKVFLNWRRILQPHLQHNREEDRIIEVYMKTYVYVTPLCS